MTPETVRALIREELQTLIRSDRFTFEKLIQILDGRNIQLGTSTGTKIGTASNQKIAFYGATPVIRASAISAPSTPSVTYSSTEAQSAVDAINLLRTAVKNFGITA